MIQTYWCPFLVKNAVDLNAFFWKEFIGCLRIQEAHVVIHGTLLFCFIVRGIFRNSGVWPQKQPF